MHKRRFQISFLKVFLKQKSFEYLDLDKSSSLSDSENNEDVSDYEASVIKFVFR